MPRLKIPTAVALAVLVAATAGSAAQRQTGYLAADKVPDATPLIGPPPTKGSGSLQGDVATYEATRALEGTPRWTLAKRDAEFGAKAFLDDVSCGLGVTLTPQNAPTLFRLLDKATVDSDAADHAAKDIYRRDRPFIDHPGDICVPRENWLVKSYSYPSGHSTFGWTAGLILAELAPDRGAAVLGRARAYGESRVVCGVHYQSDVQAGRVVASAVFAALENDPGFKADLAKARSELAALRAGGHAPADPAICKMERDAVDHPVW
jgi:acid phosphatase (class A)